MLERRYGFSHLQLLLYPNEFDRLDISYQSMTLAHVAKASDPAAAG